MTFTTLISAIGRLFAATGLLITLGAFLYSLATFSPMVAPAAVALLTFGICNLALNPPKTSAEAREDLPKPGSVRDHQRLAS